MRVQLGLVTAAALAGFVCASSAHSAPIDVLVGDKDGFGFSPACPDTGTCPGLNNPVIDNRDAAEKAATNGAQITDEYSAVFPPSFSPPGSTSTADVLFPFTGTLTSATLSFAAGDFQSDVFGALTANINGVSVPFSFADGRFVTAIHSFTLNAAELAAANLTGEVDLHLDRNSSGDFIAFDWFEVVGTTAAVPEPASLIILGGALVGFGLMRRRKASTEL
jgi:hypothetical protein